MRRLKNVLIPLPKTVEQGDVSFKVADFQGKVRIVLEHKCDMTEEAVNWIAKRLFEYNLITLTDDESAYTVKISVDPELEGMDTPEGYTVRTFAGGRQR